MESLPAHEVERKVSNLVALLPPSGSSCDPNRNERARWRRRSGDLVDQRPQDPQRIGADFAGNDDELDHVEPSLAAFVFGNKALRLAEALGELLLREAGFFP